MLERKIEIPSPVIGLIHLAHDLFLYELLNRAKLLIWILWRDFALSVYYSSVQRCIETVKVKEG